MKRFLLPLILVYGHAVAALAASPVIYFSDLGSGPNTGGQNNKGAFVTITGAHFGASRGAGSVSIGGGQADNYVIWTDSRVVFQLGPGAASGNITVTTPEGTSNGVPFTVRSGNIYFVSAASPNDPGSGTFEDPWRSPKSFMDIQAPGDICYIGEGLYTGVYGTKWNSRGKMSVDYYRGPSGTAERPIVWCGYPGQTAVFQSTGTYPECGTFSLRASHIRVCNLTLKGYGNSYFVCNIQNDGCAFINCVVGFQKTRCYGMIGVEGGTGIQIYGNEITGAASKDKSDHCVYFTGTAADVDVAWNYIHDNQIDVGPVFSYNGTVGTVTIRNNIVDCRNSNRKLDLLGQWAGVAGTYTRFYNNIVFPEVSNNRKGSIYVNTGTLDAYNNTFVNAVNESGIPLFDGTGAVSVTSVNNIFYNQPTVPVYGTNIVHSNNLYYNISGSVSETGGLTGDPLFVDAAGNDYHLAAAASPAWRSGESSEMSTNDYELTPRISPPCRGAFELTGPYAIGGAVKDGSGNGIPGVTLTLSGGATSTTGNDGRYQFADLPGQGPFTVTPSKAGVTFEPASFSVPNLGGSITDANFTGAVPPPPAYDIKGFVKDGTGAAIAGVTVTLSGGVTASTATAGDGSYQFTSLAASGTYTVTPTKAGMSFAPVAFSTASLCATITDANFIGTLDPPPVYAIKGHVRSEAGAPIAGVSMAISGGVTASTTTASDGSYQFVNLAASATYTVTPGKAGMAFNPVSFSTASLRATIADADFVGALLPPPTYAIKGYARTGTGAAIAGVSMALSGDVTASTTTTSDGSYQFVNLASSRAYTVTPAKADMTFAPVSFSTASLSATIANANFVGTPIPPPTYAIRGFVRTGTGTAIAGVTMAISGGVTASTTTASDGSYQFVNLSSGAYTITPAKTGMTFVPVSFSTASLSATISNANFVGTPIPPPVYAIRGFVRTGTGAAIAGVSMAISGGVTASTTTASDGSYQFINLAYGTYTITPAKTGMTFAPVSFSTASLSATISNANFVGTATPPPVYAIKGFVRTGSGAAIASVSMALSGGVTASTTTGSDGSYQFLNLSSGAYTVTPEKTGMTFVPVSFSTASLSATVNDANFVGAEAPPPTAALPVIYFSDLASGPKTGGQNNKGAFVTVVGAHFGMSQSGGSVSIGGGQADNYVIWTDSKVVFQLGSRADSGDITVTTQQGTSNGVPFTVRSGNIYFVSAASPRSPGTGTYADPWRSPKSFMDKQTAGDICYIQAGTYSGTYSGKWNNRWTMNVDYDRAPSGTAEKPIVWCGYPGQTAVFQATGYPAGTFALRASYIRVCNLTLKGYGNRNYVCSIQKNGCAFINCTIGFQKTRCNGMIGIESGSDIRIYGNEITGAASRDGNDHCVYFNGTAKNVDVAWNYIHGNSINTGPVFQYDGGIGAVTIRNNFIDCRNSNGNLDLLTQNGRVATAGTRFYNNIVIPTVSSGRRGTIYVNSGSLEAYNNTFVNAVTQNNVPLIDGKGATSVTAVNNIFYNQPAVPVYGSNVAHSYNLYYRVSGNVSETGGLTGDPLFVNAAGNDFHLASAASPACRNGSSQKMSASDYEQTPRGNPPCRGAFEFVGTQGALSPLRYMAALPAPANGTGEIRAYPIPLNPAKGRMTIDNLPSAASIRLFNVAGELVRTIDYTDGSGRVFWDGNNDHGSRVASGVYILLIDSPAGKKQLMIAVEK